MINFKDPEKHFLTSRTSFLGRGCDARVHLLSKFVSRDHCHIYFDKLTMKWFIRDLGSLNGTYVNNDLIDKAQPSEINLGDFIGFGIDQ